MWLSDQSDMFSLPILVLFLNTTPIIQALLPKNEAESFYGLATVAANLVTLDNTDVVIISDFELKQQVSQGGPNLFLSSQIDKLTAATRFFDYLGLYNYKRAKNQTFHSFKVGPTASKFK